MSPLNDSSLVAEFEYDVAAQAWTWSAGLRELHGLDQHTTPTTEHLLAPMHPDDRPVMLERFQRHLCVPGAYTCMYRMTGPDGRGHQLRFVGKAVARDGAVVALEGFVLDISSDVQAWTSQAIGGVMEHHAAIEQAKGALMLAFHISADEAFDMLRTFSNRQNRKLALVAEQISTGLSDPALADKDPVTVLLEIVGSSASRRPLPEPASVPAQGPATAPEPVSAQEPAAG